MTISFNEMLKIADLIASKSDVKNHKVACILIDENGDIVTTGYNHYSNGSKRLGRRTVHAEMDALSKVRKPSKNLSMILYRNHNRPIHPCACCSTLIKAYSIKKVISLYTMDEVDIYAYKG